MKISNEMKTGLFVLICIAALFGMLIKVGNFNIFKKGYTVKTQFHFSGGIKKSSPVCLSGVNVGEVKDIRLLYDNNDTVAEVVLWLEEGTQLRKDSVANVATLGFMGEKYIEIRSGASQELVEANGLIQGKDPVRMEDLVEIGTKVADDIGKTARDISKVTNHVDEMLQDNRSKVDNIFDNLEETSENFNDFSQDVKYHPWKVLAKGKEATKEQMLKDREMKRIERVKKRGEAYVPETGMETVVAQSVGVSSNTSAKKKSNFGPANS